MAEPQNPYSPPRSDIAVPQTGTKPVYSPVQGFLGTFLGGPLAGAYFLRANYLAKGEGKRAMHATIWGLVVTAILLLILPFLPAKTPNYIIPITYSVAVRLIIEKLQFTKAQIAASNHFSFHSNRRVVGIALACLAIFIVLVLGGFVFLVPPSESGANDLPIWPS
jgi:hypothetical protein